MIELKGITKKFDNTIVLDNIDLTINKGTAFGLLGSNGAGKSTILRLLSGVYNQEGGNLTIDGDTVYDNVETKKRVFFVNDETAQFSGYTLTELKNFYKHYYPNFSEELFEKMRLTINLPTDKKISTFSKGMKRQAIVIIALACQTDYLLLDEAFDGLDPTMRIIVKRMLVDAMIDRQLTTIISSHNLKEINELCDTVALLHNGKIVFSRDLDSVKGNIHKVQVVFSQSNENQSQDYTIEELAGEGLEILHFEKSQSVYHIIVKGDTELVKKKIQEKNPVVLDIIPLSLEEIFIYEMEVLGYDFNSLENK
ncbi:MAG: ABC transporter ATP-binding protein [Clostridiales bacterium]|mgnify:CR=1 FL=1|jgi:ABC-2 type transport system ATP-binding protein|nr:ABC transporter ATP-binding protein [Clostridiales bacterium]